LKQEQWGSPLAQEKCQEEKACDKRNNNNNNVTITITAIGITVPERHTLQNIWHKR